MDYYDIYKLRLNRYGLNYQQRIQNEREQLFDLYLLKSNYRINFMYNNLSHPGSFEKYKQDETKTLRYLLTKIDLVIPNGTILQLPNSNQNPDTHPWMVYYLESIEASGYNRYIMLNMTHYLTWQSRDGTIQHSWAYMYGQEDNMLKDELKSRSRMDAVYNENLKSSFFIMPKNPYIKRDDYLTIGEEPFIEGYRVTGYDLQSTENIEYVTVDPVYIHDTSPIPQPASSDDEEDFYWFTGGLTNGT